MVRVVYLNQAFPLGGRWRRSRRMRGNGLEMVLLLCKRSPPALRYYPLISHCVTASPEGEAENKETSTVFHPRGKPRTRKRRQFSTRGGSREQGNVDSFPPEGEAEKKGNSDSRGETEKKGNSDSRARGIPDAERPINPINKEKQHIKRSDFPSSLYAKLSRNIDFFYCEWIFRPT